MSKTDTNTNDILIQSNEMIDKRINFNLTENRLYYSVVSRVDAAKPDFSKICFSIREFMDEWSLSSKVQYEQVKKGITNLQGKVYEYEMENGKRIGARPYFLSIEYDTESKVIEVEINPVLRNHFLRLQREFTITEFTYLRSLKHAHTMRLYELLSSYRGLGLRTFTGDELNLYLTTENASYDNLSNLESRAIRPAVEGINEHTDLDVSYAKHGRGKDAKYAFAIAVKGEQPKAIIEPSETIPYGEIIDYLNEKAGTAYKATAKKNREYIKRRWKEGNRLEDFKAVIDNKVAEWFGNEKMEKFLRPETLFGEKFDRYLGTKKSEAKDKTDETECMADLWK